MASLTWLGQQKCRHVYVIKLYCFCFRPEWVRMHSSLPLANYHCRCSITNGACSHCSYSSVDSDSALRHYVPQRVAHLIGRRELHPRGRITASSPLRPVVNSTDWFVDPSGWTDAEKSLNVLALRSVSISDRSDFLSGMVYGQLHIAVLGHDLISSLVSVIDTDFSKALDPLLGLCFYR